MNKTMVVNLIGGAGSGKSRLSAMLFSKLKFAGINCELITEVAKEHAWDGRLDGDVDELLLFAEQNHRQYRLNGKVDLMVTDAPLYLKLMYGIPELGDQAVNGLVYSYTSMYNNVNFMLTRVNPYNPKGRVQTEEEAIADDQRLRDIFDTNFIPYYEVLGNEEGVDDMVDIVKALI